MAKGKGCVPHHRVTPLCKPLISYLCLSQSTVWLWASHSDSLCLGFLTSGMNIWKHYLMHKLVVTVKWDDMCKVLRILSGTCQALKNASYDYYCIYSYHGCCCNGAILVLKVLVISSLQSVLFISPSLFHPWFLSKKNQNQNKQTKNPAKLLEVLVSPLLSRWRLPRLTGGCQLPGSLAWFWGLRCRELMWKGA